MGDNTIIGIIGGILGASITIFVIIWALSSSCEQVIRASGGNIDKIAWHCQILLPKLVESMNP